MGELANLILSKLIILNHIDLLEALDIDREDLIDAIYRLWENFDDVEEIIVKGYSLDDIVSNDELIDTIIDLIYEPIDNKNIQEILNG